MSKLRQAVTLGGKPFEVIDFERRTVVQDHYMSKLVRSLGLDKVMPMDGEPDAAYVVRLQTALLDTGRAQELLAGYLLPAGKTERDWTQAMAKEIAAHIGQCDTQEDRDMVVDLAMQAVFGFFKQGLARLRHSATSLRASPEQLKQSRAFRA